MPTFQDLPNDVLLQIFACLPLRSVLKIEVTSQRLHQAVSAYLSTVKSINLYHHHVKRDMFRCSDPNAGTIPASCLEVLLERCGRARSIVHLGSRETSASYRELLEVISHFTNITTLEFVDNKVLLDEILARNANLIMNEVAFNYVTCDVTTRLSLCNTTVVHLNDVTVDFPLSIFSNCVDISYIRCSFNSDSLSELQKLSLPNVRKFEYIDKPGNSASSRVGSVLLAKAVQSEKLALLHLGLNEFFSLEAAFPDWNATRLEHLQVESTGTYSACLQQLKYASVIADICHLCRDTLQIISLPSSILIKRFFNRLISAGLPFQKLRTLKMTGIADTKMFLSPGNLVETVFYQEFLKLCPMMASLSLHSYSGSLVILVLPLTLKELVLPWDNRLNLVKQWDEIAGCLLALLHLTSLSILGVEEVDALLFEVPTRQRIPDLVINMQSLQVFRIKNACVLNIDLSSCSRLDSFSIQCCPTLQELNLPGDTLSEVRIYDQHRSYIGKFVSDFVASRSTNDCQHFCHIHIQLHSVLKQEPDAKKQHHRAIDNLSSVCEAACTDTSSTSDFLILKDISLHLFEHNSGEPMFPFTEFYSQGRFTSVRSENEVIAETSRRELILEGLDRWKACLVGLKNLVRLGRLPAATASSAASFDTTYCGSRFKCVTNLSCLPILNALPHVCQSSGTSSVTVAESEVNPAVFSSLNVPYPGQTGNDFMNCGQSVTANPLLLISIIEYTHDIYTLFYYD